MPAPFTTPVAQSVPFEANRLNSPWWPAGVPTDIESQNVQDAIEEAKYDALNNDRYPVQAFLNGTANTGKWLEVFPGASSDTSPLYVPEASALRGVTVNCSAKSSGVLQIVHINGSNVVLYQLSMQSQDRFYSGAINVFIPAGSDVGFKILSGALQKPGVRIWINTQI